MTYWILIYNLLNTLIMKRMIMTLLSVSIFASTLFATDKEFKREITKEFSTGANPTLQVDNKYGHIRIVEGTENKIIFKIEIIGKGTTEALAKQYAETVTVDFSQNGDKISATTSVEPVTCNNCGRSTNYTVVTPKGVMMNLTNKYGNIFLENAVKPLRVDLKYGNLEANTLTNLNLDIKYGNVSINVCEELKIDCGYAKFKISRAGRMNIDSKYDDFQIGTVTDLKINTKYTKIKIDKLNNGIVCDDFKYCSLDISEISTQFSLIKIKAGYSNLKLALDKRHSFKAGLRIKYGKIIAGDLTFNNVSLQNKEKNTDAIKGTAGSNNNPSATVDISASYGNVTFK